MEIKIIDAEILSEICSYAILMYKGPSKDNLIISKVQVCPLSREQEQDHLVVGRISRPADQIDPSPCSTLPPGKLRGGKRNAAPPVYATV